MPLLTATDLFFFNVLGRLAVDGPAPELPSNIDWERLSALTARHGVGAVFSHYYGRSDSVPGHIRRRWREALMSVLLLNERSLKATVRVLRILGKAGIRAAVLRGMALIQGVYPEPYLRAMQDVDILVESSAADAIEPALRARGLLPAKKLRGQVVYVVDETDIEVHWSLLTPKRYRGIANFDRWVGSTVNTATPHGDIPCLSPEHEFLDLVCHAFIHHELDSVQGLVDIGRLIAVSDIDWEYIRSWCAQSRTTRMFRFVLAFADYLLELGIDAEQIGLDSRLPRRYEKVFDAYTAVLADRDTVQYFLRRKGNLLFVAEHPFTKLKQIIRFFGRREFGAFLGIMRGARHFEKTRKHVGFEERRRAGGE